MVDTSTVVGNMELYDVQGALSDVRVRVLVNSMITLNIYETIKRKTTLAHRTPPLNTHTHTERFDMIRSLLLVNKDNTTSFMGRIICALKLLILFPKGGITFSCRVTWFNFNFFIIFGMMALCNTKIRSTLRCDFESMTIKCTTLGYPSLGVIVAVTWSHVNVQIVFSLETQIVWTNQ